MNAGLFITRVASERRDAQNERDGAGLRSFIAAPSQVAAALQPSSQLASSSCPSSRCCQQHLEEGRGGTSRRDARCAQHQLRRSSISSVAAAAAGDGSVLRPLGSPSNGQPLDGFPTRFLAQKTLVTLKKRGPNKKLFLARRACTSGNRIYIVVITV